VYAHRRDSEWHGAASAALAELTDRVELWAIPWPCVHEFLNVVTSQRVFHAPTSMMRARQQVEAWMESPFLRTLSETSRHWPVLADLLIQGRIAGRRVHDARIAALCLEHGVDELWSADRDFSRIAGLKVRNPLLGRA
ncbi:MAG: type II toxin-antitoxin system VapC family toxin, partial [Streptosporangiaceae bacterium]